MWPTGAEGLGRWQSRPVGNVLGSSPELFSVRLRVRHNKARLAPGSSRHPTTRAQAKPIWIAAAILVGMCLSTTGGLSEQQNLQLSPPALALSAAIADSDPATSGSKRAAQFGQSISTTAVQLAQAKTSDTEDLRQALAQEQRKGQALTRDLRMSRQELDTALRLLQQAREQWSSITEAAENDSEKLRKSLQEEHARGQRLEQELAQTRRDLELQAALTSTAGNEDSKKKQGAERDLQELQRVAQQERDRAGRLEQDLAVARRELDTQSALATKVNADAIGAKEAAQNGLAELQQTFQQERDRATRLEEDLATTRHELENRSSEVMEANEEMAQIRRTADSTAAKLRFSLKEEHDRAEGLAQELSLTRTKLFAYEAYAAANDGGSKELRQLLDQERSRSSRLERELVTAHQTPERTALTGAPSPALGVVATDRALVIETQAAGSVQPAANAGGAKLGHEHAAEVLGLTARATGLLRQGDISAARAVLERAAELGSAQAHFALAETYDPNVLAKWGAYGTRSDAIRARELYAKAEAKGVTEAKERFDALGQ